MNITFVMKWLTYVISAMVLIFGFLLFYNDTHEPIGSLAAALLSAMLTLASLVMLTWLVQVFLK